MLHALRMVALGGQLAVISVLGIVTSLRRPFHPDNTTRCANWFGHTGLPLLGVKLHADLRALEAHGGPAVIVCNHISNYDLYVYGGMVPSRTVTLGKTSLKWLPLFGQLYWLTGNVLIDRGNARKAKAAMQATTRTLVENKSSILVFAEGTRGHGRGLGPLKKGAFQMAIAAGVPILPVCVNNYARDWRPSRKQTGTVHMRALAPIPTAGLTADDVPALLAQCEQAMRKAIEELDVAAGTAHTAQRHASH
jgi:1-acyl-sn-glycerol-3-phosphate acyltransferase